MPKQQRALDWMAAELLRSDNHRLDNVVRVKKTLYRSLLSSVGDGLSTILALSVVFVS